MRGGSNPAISPALSTVRVPPGWMSLLGAVAGADVTLVMPPVGLLAARPVVADVAFFAVVLLVDPPDDDDGRAVVAVPPPVATVVGVWPTSVVSLVAVVSVVCVASEVDVVAD